MEDRSSQLRGSGVQWVTGTSGELEELGQNALRPTRPEGAPLAATVKPPAAIAASVVAQALGQEWPLGGCRASACAPTSQPVGSSRTDRESHRARGGRYAEPARQ